MSATILEEKLSKGLKKGWYAKCPLTILWRKHVTLYLMVVASTVEIAVVLSTSTLETCKWKHVGSFGAFYVDAIGHSFSSLFEVFCYCPDIISKFVLPSTPSSRGDSLSKENLYANLAVVFKVSWHPGIRWHFLRRRDLLHKKNTFELWKQHSHVTSTTILKLKNSSFSCIL